MKAVLAKHVPKNTPPSKYKEALDNSSFVLQPYADLLLERLDQLDRLTEEDFKGTDALGLVAFRGGRRAEIQLFLDILPDTVKKHR